MVLSKKKLGLLIKEARTVKSKRIKKRYTQKLLAEDINKSQSYIGDIESGRTYPSFVILNKIAEACEVDISYFLDENNLNEDIDKFIKIQINGMKNDEIHEMREELKQDPDMKINYIYDYVNDGNAIVNEVSSKKTNTLFTTPKEAIKYLLTQPVIMELCNIDINSLTDGEVTDFINNVISQLKLISYKYKK